MTQRGITRTKGRYDMGNKKLYNKEEKQVGVCLSLDRKNYSHYNQRYFSVVDENNFLL